MNRTLFSLALALATCALPAAASAQSSPARSGPAAMTDTMICRHAAATEKPMAMMAEGAGLAGLVCKTVTADTMAKLMAKNAGPDLSAALTPQQADAAWRAWLLQTFTVPVGGS